MIQSKFRSPHKLTTRAELLSLLDSAIYTESYRFARQISLMWLAYFPGDLPVRLKYGHLLLNAGQKDQAIQQLTELCLADPEYLDAWQLLSVSLEGYSKNPAATDSAFFIADCQSALHALGENIIASAPLPSWADGVLRARQALFQGEISTAEEYIHQVMVVDPMPALVAVTHLHILRASELPSQAVQNLSEFYGQRFQNTVAPTFFLAEALMDSGEPDKAVAFLHQGVSLDVSGLVANRIWRDGNPYTDIWPDQLEAPIEIPIPAEVAALYGRNRLPQQSSPSNYQFNNKNSQTENDNVSDDKRINHESRIFSPEVIQLREPKRRVSAAASGIVVSEKASAVPESLVSIHSELEKVATRLKKRPLSQQDGRYPVYVVITTRQGLENHYPQDQVDSLDECMKRVVQNVSTRQDWGAVLVYADDPECMSAFDLNPVASDDPWSLKLALADIDSFLVKRGEMIGALLIVGGPEVVPYHNLPNPVDDVDVEVPSDNPYATRDENYFVPEWPVGRMPGGTHNDAGLLIQGLNRIADHHAQKAQIKGWFQRLWDRIALRRIFTLRRKKSSWGYTAAIWRRASLSVFRPIGAPHTMYISPPVQAEDENDNQKNGSFPTARMGYFNLHGLQDSSHWYGQRDPSEPTELPDYPIALRPQDVVNGGQAPSVVFSEACYGAHISGKGIDEALALKFLDSGSQTVVGSTCTSYGSITTPLIAADLLGQAFWKFLRDGLLAGEALRRAKIHLAKEMHQRQGYLDGEDQKTLISFLLFGDPLAQLTNGSPQSKMIMRSKIPPSSVNTVCDRDGNCSEDGHGIQHPLQDDPPIPSKTLAQVKTIVEQYLPGMQDANIQYGRSKARCSGDGHSCPTSNNRTNAKSRGIPEHNVVTLSKHVEKTISPSGEIQTHHHFARLTIDDGGKVIKMAVSR
jgi:tetratricopeptide (TPR) repeat protein